MTNAEKIFDIARLQSAIANAIEEMTAENAHYPNDPLEIRDWGVETIAADWHGVHMPGIIASTLQLDEPDDCDDWEEIMLAYNADRELYLSGEVAWSPDSPWDRWEFAWEEIDSQTGAMADEMNELCADFFAGHSLYFGQLEGRCDYMLIVAMEDCNG